MLKFLALSRCRETGATHTHTGRLPYGSRAPPTEAQQIFLCSLLYMNERLSLSYQIHLYSPRWGSIPEYLLSAGFTEKDQERLKSAFLDEQWQEPKIFHKYSDYHTISSIQPEQQHTTIFLQSMMFNYCGVQCHALFQLKSSVVMRVILQLRTNHHVNHLSSALPVM